MYKVSKILSNCIMTVGFIGILTTTYPVTTTYFIILCIGIMLSMAITISMEKQKNSIYELELYKMHFSKKLDNLINEIESMDDMNSEELSKKLNELMGEDDEDTDMFDVESGDNSIRKCR